MHLQVVRQFFQASHTPASRAQLCSLFSETALFLGKLLSTDMHMPDEALSYYRLSLAAAQQANDAILYATVLGRIGELAVSLSKPDEALVFLQEAQRLVGHQEVFTLRAWLAAEEAEMHADSAQWYRSQSDRPCFQALEKVEILAGQIRAEEDTFGVYFDRSRIAGYQGSCNLRLHRPEIALEALHEALRPLDHSGALARAVLLDMAEASIQANSPGQACSYITQAAEIMIHTKSSLQRIYTLREQLEPWKAVQEVKSLDSYLQRI
jgi:tetratricopeptide (TPR) repeat protein